MVITSLLTGTIMPANTRKSLHTQLEKMVFQQCSIPVVIVSI